MPHSLCVCVGACVRVHACVSMRACMRACVRVYVRGCLLNLETSELNNLSMVIVSNAALVSKRINRTPRPESNVHNVLLGFHQSCFFGAATYLRFQYQVGLQYCCIFQCLY